MAEFLLKPKEQELEHEEAKAPAVQFDQLEDELAGAVRAEGADNVAEAVAEVVTGQARPEALLAWMDDLRDPEEQVEQEDKNLERSFTVDFIPDTMRDGSATDVPPRDDYMFSAVRTTADDHDGGDGGGGGGGGGSGEGDGAAEGAEGTDGKDPPKAPAKGAVAAPKKQTPSKPEPPTKPSGKARKPDDNK